MKPPYSNKVIQRAGDILINNEIDKDSEEYLHSVDILSYYRNKHIEALDKTSSMLSKHTKIIDKNAIVAKRLKRIPSIINKLNGFNTMKLNRMQDIAGCRIILSTERKVRKVERELLRENCKLLKDYIKNPKDDGYRGIHLINKNFKFPVEIQLRTQLQHSWATAIEIVDLFEEEHLKTNTRLNKKNSNTIDWLSFFAHISNEFSLIEHSRNAERKYPLEDSVALIDKFNIIKKFLAYTESLNKLNQHLEKLNITNSYNLIRINLYKATLEIESFASEQIENATIKYLEYEKEAIKNTYLVIALVSTESFDNLKEAYPNYFADSRIFIENINIIKLKHKNRKSKNNSTFLDFFKL